MKRCNISESFKPKKGYNISKKKLKQPQYITIFFWNTLHTLCWGMHAVYNVTYPDPHPDIKVYSK